MKKRIISSFLAAAMLVGALLATGAFAAAEDTEYPDVPATRWSAESIGYVTEQGMMTDTGSGKFEPAKAVNRAMVVTVLYRIAGEPNTTRPLTFTDVPEGKWYTAAVAWGVEKEIVTGFSDNTFRPMDDVTREQLVTFIGRFAEQNYVVTNGTDLTAFSDSGKIKDYAMVYFKWAVNVGLVKGVTDTEIRPTAGATREQFAAIIHRYDTCKTFDYELVYNAPVPLSTFTEEDYPLQDDADLFVSPDGDDSNPGTKDKPLATLEGAKLAVRELKKTKTGDIKVAFMAGTYPDTNVVFTSEDSGNGGTVTYCAYGDGQVDFNNAYKFTADDLTTLTGDTEKSYFKSKYVSDIKKIDVSDVMTVDEIESAVIFNDDEMIFTARYPNRDTEKDQDGYISNCCSLGGKNQLIIAEPYKTRMDGYHTYEGAFLYGFYYWDYYREMGRIEEYDRETGTVTLSGIHGVSDYWKSREFVIVNVSEELDKPGEYWIDPATLMLYIYDPSGEYELAYNMEELVKIEEGADGITFKNVDFSCGTGERYYGDTESPATVSIKVDGEIVRDPTALNAIRDSSAIYTMQGCSNIIFDGCEVSKMGNSYALFLDGVNVEFINGEVHELSGGGIFSYCGDEYYHNNLISAGKVIRNSYIHNNGHEYVSYHQGIYTCDVGAEISHNEFYKTPHNAVMPIGVETIIEYNYIHECNTVGDGAPIYSGHSYTRVGNVIRYNIFSDNGGGFHIYLDDGLSGIQVYGNLFYNSENVTTTAIRMSGGRENSIYDNVAIVFGSVAFDRVMEISAKFTDKFYYALYVDFEEIKYSGTWLGWRIHDRLPTTEEGMAIWAEKYPWYAATDFDYLNWETKWQEPTFFTIPYNDTIKDNYAFVPGGESGDIKYDFGDETGVIEKYGDVQNNQLIDLTENPLFVNPAVGDYTICEEVDDSLVSKTPYIPFAEIGRY